MDRQTLRDWVRRYNSERVAGLKSSYGPGKPPSLTGEHITRLPLPPYAPELNPMENVREYLRQNKLCALVWDT